MAINKEQILADISKILSEQIDTPTGGELLENLITVGKGRGGHGYLESFLRDSANKRAMDAFITAVSKFVDISAQWAAEEEISEKEQRVLILQDLLGTVVTKVK